MSIIARFSNMRYLPTTFFYCAKRLYNEKRAAECYLKSTINLQEEIPSSANEIVSFITSANPFNLLNQVKIDQLATKFKSKSFDVRDEYYISNILKNYQEALSIYNRIYQTQKVFLYDIDFMRSELLEENPYKLLYFENGSRTLEMFVEFSSHSDPVFCAFWDEDASQLHIGRKKEEPLELSDKSQAICRFPKRRKIWISMDLQYIRSNKKIEVFQTTETQSTLLIQVGLY